MRTILSLFLSAAFAFPAFAQVPPTSDRPMMRDGMRAVAQDMRQDIHAARASTTEEIRAIRDAMMADMQAMRAAMGQKRAEFRSAMEARRARAQADITAHRDTLKAKLLTIRDERKQQAVERINAGVIALNDRMLKHFASVLENIENILVRIGERADRAQEQGRDVSAARAAITAAHDAIATSRAAITAQSGKTYSVTVNEEGTLRRDVGATRQALHNDLSAVRETVRKAHDAARQAAVALAQAERPAPTATSSPDGTAAGSN
ncbi:MAG: hypothetical protein AAB581_01730 [Patescibacteria group bacterium]